MVCCSSKEAAIFSRDFKFFLPSTINSIQPWSNFLIVGQNWIDFRTRCSLMIGNLKWKQYLPACSHNENKSCVNDDTSKDPPETSQESAAVHIDLFKVHIFWESHKILQNLHLTFDWHYLYRTKVRWRFFKILWASSEYMNFTTQGYIKSTKISEMAIYFNPEPK